MTNGQLKHHQFVIGSHNASATRVGTLRKRQGERVGNVTGVVENRGAKPFTFGVRTSSDNGAADPWAAAPMRIGATDVPTVTVVPGGRAEFTIPGAVTENYVECFVDDQTGAAGVVTLHTSSGEFGEVGQSGVAYPG